MRYVVCQTQCNLVLSISVSLRQLSNRSSSAIAYAYHPGTVLTPFTFPIIGSPKPDLSQSRLTVDQAIDHLVNVMSQVKRGVQGSRDEGDWGGRCWDWKGQMVEW